MQISIIKETDKPNLATVVFREQREGVSVMVRRIMPLGDAGELNTEDLAVETAIAEAQIENKFAAGAVL